MNELPKLVALVCRMAGWNAAHTVELIIDPVNQFHIDGRPTGEQPDTFTYIASIEVSTTKIKAQGKSRLGFEAALLDLARSISMVYEKQQRLLKTQTELAFKLYNEYHVDLAKSKQ